MFDVNLDTEPSFPKIPAPWQKWLRIAGYIGLVLLLAWIYTHSPEGDQWQEQPRPIPPAASTSQTQREERTPSRNAPAAQKTVRERSPSPENRRESRATATDRDQDHERESSFIARNVRITNESGRVIYRGDVDVGPTLERIDRGKRLRFSHDGIVFENREKRLPQKPRGYYREFIHPTKGESGPGGQRVVTGQNGEAYYSPDHYRTFQRVR